MGCGLPFEHPAQLYIDLPGRTLLQVVLIFGEIIPQSICTRYGLQVGAYSAYFVRVLMVFCALIAWPISKLLDWVLGPEYEVPPAFTSFGFLHACLCARARSQGCC